MQIHSESLNRLSQSQMRGEGLATIYEHLAVMASNAGTATAQVNISWHKAGDNFVDGDMLPILTLTLQPAPTHASDPAADVGTDNREDTNKDVDDVSKRTESAIPK